MTNRRVSRRIPFRKRVRYGLTNPNFSGYTSNISASGIKIESHKIFAPQSEIIVHIHLGDVGIEEGVMEDVAILEGVVVWVSATLPGTLAKMGIKFVSRADDVNSIYRQRLHKYSAGKE
jgi:hypothetical protein